MAFLVTLLVLFPSLVFIFFLIVLHESRNKNSVIPTNWPIVGMIPKTVMNSHRIPDYVTDILAYTDGTFLFKSGGLIKTRICTANPSDVHHILSKNFNNYPRGDSFHQIFDILGDGFTNTDGELWEFQHNVMISLFKSPSFQPLLEETVWNKVEQGLMPVLEYVSKQEVEIDLQDIFQRFTFDTICVLLFDRDPKSMSLDLPYVPCEKALSEFEEVILFRYITPPSFWKIQQVLRLGSEKRLSNAWKALDEFIYKNLAQKQKDLNELNSESQEHNFKISTSLLRSYKDQSGTSGDPNKFLRDTLLNLLVAGRDTNSTALSWLFYLLSKNPIAVDKILEELHTQLNFKEGVNLKDLQAINLHKLIYLHGALCESLRLFSPVPFQVKTPFQPDVLPSGHQVDRDSMILLSFYSMGRMKSIWGEDCMEFKPERWISESGGIIHQPSYKFPAFNAGPRTCLGKHMSFTQMKILAATILYNYNVNVVEGQLVVPSDSMMLKMKNGLKVRLSKRR